MLQGYVRNCRIVLTDCFERDVYYKGARVCVTRLCTKLHLSWRRHTRILWNCFGICLYILRRPGTIPTAHEDDTNKFQVCDPEDSDSHRETMGN